MFLDKFFNKRKPIQPDTKNSLCLYPFFNLMVTANGKYKPCCKWQEVLHDKGNELRAPKDTFEDAFDSDEMKQLRKDFLEGKKPAKCAVCWEEEIHGIKSMRYDSYDYDFTDHILKSPTPRRLDIYPGNTCNLRCRICSPEYSTKWIKEAKETQGFEQETYFNLTEKNMQQFQYWLPNIVEIGLFGGEPLLLKECYTLMKHCVEKGYSKNITLLINTNATIYSPELIDLFNSFKKVLLNFSIDDIGERFEYQRKGADWDKVVSNIQEYLKSGGLTHEDKIECKMCCTVSSFNIYYLPEYFQWLHQTFPGMKVYINFLHRPFELSVSNLPEAVKEKVKAKLLASSGDYNLKFEDKETRTFKNIIDFIDTTPNQSFNHFFHEINRGDNYRHETFQKVFPEFWELIQSYLPEKEQAGTT